MRGLFLKIFVVLWAAMSSVGALVILVGDIGNQQIQQDRWREITANAFGVYAASVAGDHHNPTTWSSRASLNDLENRTGIRAYLFDSQGRMVSSPTISAPFSLTDERQLRKLVESARDEQTDLVSWQGLFMAARGVRLPDGHRYTLAGFLPRTHLMSWEMPQRVHVLRMVAILLIAALVSWGLTRHLTMPIWALSGAAQRLAEGDLTARVGAQLQRRGDELGVLSNDFDTMADRLQTLVAEKESLLAEKEQLVRLQQRLLGDVSHELRSPLTRVAIAVELARDLLPTSSPNLSTTLRQSAEASSIEAALDRIEHETGRLNDLIARLLTLSRLESGVQKPGDERVDFAALTRAVAADADFEAQALGSHVHMGRCDACTVKGNIELLRSAVENVIRNASRYTPEGKAVEVSLIRTESNCTLAVRDHGPGIPEIELANVFRPFYRVAGNIAPLRAKLFPSQTGAGLGLAITARAIELHGGTIVARNASDTGLIIEICLPDHSQ